MTPSTKFKPVDEQLAYLRRGAAEIIREDELRARLESSLQSGKPLRVKLGVDATAPDLHLGHTVVLRKLKHFQDLGHTAIFLVGDFTSLVGDPTGQSETRPPLSREQVEANAKTYLEQVYKILDEEKTEVRFNSEWLGKLTSDGMIKLCAHYRLARMLEREDFRSRLAGNQPIAIHELLYPLLQAYDSVALAADVELGATEQKFNLLAGREIQREYGQASQVALTVPILVGTDGERKMSKSLGNYVGITEPAGEMFGKLMSIPDALMWTYYELLTELAPDELAALRQRVEAGQAHPRDAKMDLALRIVAEFHGEATAHKAAEEFRRVFRERQAPEEAPVRKLAPGTPKRLVALLVELGLAASRSEAERLVKQGGVEIDGTRVDDIKKQVPLRKSSAFLVRAGKKKFLRVVVE
ncbi:MAG TPA: tyrosine--tRNA ligase [Candidatus Acidoferrales bacterium]|nr:tyrosine--tRNA ligase [Candidatus Acidoferrales bacterium]